MLIHAHGLDSTRLTEPMKLFLADDLIDEKSEAALEERFPF